MAKARVKLDSSKLIVKKMYRPGAPMARFAAQVAREAEVLAKTNNGRGWNYQRPGGDVRGQGRNGVRTIHGAYARSVHAETGNSSHPRVTLTATAQHARLVEFGNGMAPIRRKADASVLRAPAVRAVQAKMNATKRVDANFQVNNANNRRTARGKYMTLLLTQKEEHDERFKDRMKSLNKDLDKAKNLVARFNLDVPGGHAMPRSVRPMGRGKRGGIAEFKGYGTINRAMRQAVRDAQKRARR